MATLDNTRRKQRLARREREQEIVQAARRLFDERRMQEAGLDEIAAAAGISKTIIYRHFPTKEDLFTLTLLLYLDELAELVGAIDPALPPAEHLRSIAEIHADYCLRYPAYIDCSLSLMRHPVPDLRERLSDATIIQAGRAIAKLTGHVARTLTEAADEGTATLRYDPDFEAARFYAQAFGTMHLPRGGVGTREIAPGTPAAFAIDPTQARDACVADALASIGITP